VVSASELQVSLARVSGYFLTQSLSCSKSYYWLISGAGYCILCAGANLFSATVATLALFNLQYWYLAAYANSLRQIFRARQPAATRMRCTFVAVIRRCRRVSRSQAISPPCLRLAYIVDRITNIARPKRPPCGRPNFASCCNFL
jgi:hypothetical protein